MALNPEYGFPRPDQDMREERVSITVDSLLEDNHSSIADERRNTWYETRAKGKLIKIRMCSDARGVLPEPDEEVVVHSIASGPSAGLLLESPGIESAVIMTHFDGDTVLPGKAPEGCGGLKVKENHNLSGKNTGKIDSYVEKHIFHPDPIIQACISAEQVAGNTDKPVLAAAQDHRDGSIYPLAVYYTYNDSIVRSVNRKISKMLLGHQYNPEVLYEDGIPVIFPDEAFKFDDFLQQSRQRVRFLKERYPNLHEESKIQDPSLVVLSTCVIPFSTRFPMTGDKPGAVFEVFVPRTRMGSSIRITPDDLQPSLEQMEYPVKASLDNHGQEGKPFAGTNTILIDTEQMAFSGALALSFVRQEQWIPKWLSLPNHKILVSETTEGVITRIRELTSEDFSRITY